MDNRTSHKEMKMNLRQKLEIEADRIAFILACLKAGARLIERGEEFVLDTTTGRAWGPDYENRQFTAERYLASKKVKENRPIVVSVRRHSQNINGNDYPAGIIAGTFKYLGDYGGREFMICVVKEDGQEIGILIDDIVDVIAA